MSVQGTDCEHCGKEIGLEGYVVCYDGISAKTVTFHHRCMQQMSDIQKNYGVQLEPARLGFSGKDFG
jgi:hypothetical protein